MKLDPGRHQSEKRFAAGDTAILFVHGIQGSPCQFRFITDKLPREISFHNLLLPGHGGNYRKFRESGIVQWQHAVTAAAAELKARYEKVYFVGHSMGCLLGLRASSGEGISFDGMLLIACPLKLHFTFRYLLHFYLPMFARNSKNVFMQASVEANSISAKYPWQYFSCIHPYMELLRLKKMLNHQLCDPGSPVFAHHMERDEIVSARSLKILKEKCSAETERHFGCGHNYFTDAAKRDMLNTLKIMIQTTL